MRKFKILYLIIALSLFANTYAFPQAMLPASNRQHIGFNDQWSFSKDEKTWQKVTLPHTWNDKDVMDDEPGYYRGMGYYKRQFKTNPSQKGKNIYLSFEGVNQESEVFVNGKSAGTHIGGYTGFILPISSLLKFDGDGANEIVVKVTNRHNDDIAPLSADFTFFGGIYRHVNVIITDQVHFSTADYGSKGVYITTPVVSKESAQVKVKGLLENSSAATRSLQLKSVVFDAQGKVVSSKVTAVSLKAGEKRTLIQDLPTVAQPSLWSPAQPTLYRIESSIIDTKTKTVLDLISNPLGFRWFKFDAEKGFFLNGEPLKLIGASRHQDYEALGNAVPEALQIRDVQLLKDMGGNFLRVAHYPQDPVILQMCDRLGILASVEIPIVNAITETEAFTQNSINMQIEMIRQHFNHPSVIMWAYMNEVLLRPKFGNDKERQKVYFENIRKLAQTLEDLTRKEDDSRVTMMACHGDFDGYKRVGLTTIPMVLGWNLYQGWYGGTLSGFGQFLDRHHKELPNMPMLVTEYGADADPRIRSFAPVRFDKSMEYAMKFNQVYLNDIINKPYVLGGMVWNLADFNSETREETMPHINNKGLLTLGRKPKDLYYLYQAYLLKEPYLKIASAHWNERTGVADSIGQFSTQPLQVVTNLPEVELFLNGKSLGVKKAVDHLAEWQVPFADGVNHIRAVNPANTLFLDQADIKFTLLPYRYTNDGADFKTLNILLGSKRYVIDEHLQELWIPDQPYRKGSWGHIGGEPFKAANDRMSYGSDRNILGTDLDPLYQTQQINLSQYKLDVPDGEYELSLFFAELLGGSDKEALAYNLGSKEEKEKKEQRVFSLKVNGALFLDNFNIAAEYGVTTGLEKKIRVNVTAGKGLVLDFIPVNGRPVLNALKLRKITL